MTGTISIIGTIGKCGEEQGIELVDVVQQVKSQPDADSFVVYINSEGGNMQTGLDIYNYLKGLKVPVTTVGAGVVASMATVIFMAGSKRQIQEGTLFLIHSPMGSLNFANPQEADEFVLKIKEAEQKLVDFYVSHTNLDQESVLPLMRSNSKLSAEQLTTFGFVTEEPLQLVAKIDIQKHTKMKDSKENEILAWLKNMFAKAQEPEIVNKVILTADQRELVFADLAQDASVSVGDKATIDGAAATGTILLQDGTELVFDDSSAVVEIKEMEPEDMDDLKKALEEKEAEVAMMKITQEQLQAKLNEQAEKLKETEGIVAKYNAIEGKMAEFIARQKPEANPTPQPKQSAFMDAVSILEKNQN